MAGEIDGVSGSWGTISFELPDYLEDVREQINDVAQVLITFLDIAITALQLIKAFAFAFLDPIKAIVQAIIDLINGLLRDFSQLGIYITHDLSLLQEGWPFKALRGGYSEYERRMIARLTDRKDPTRPDLSADTPVFAGFFYQSVDVSAIQQLIAFIRQLLAMFNLKQGAESSLPTPVIDRVDYGSASTGLFGGLSNLTEFGAEPNKARVTWRVPDPSRGGLGNPISTGPDGFVVTVSTVPEPLSLHFDRPGKDSGSGRTARGSGDTQQRREQGPLRDDSGKPVMLYGGAEMLSFDQSELGWNNSISGGAVKPGTARVFGKLRDGDSAATGIIPLGDMKGVVEGVDTYYWQRTFYVPYEDAVLQFATKEYSYVLDLDEMPHHAEVTMGDDGKATVKDLGKPATYYVRVSSTSKKVAEFKYVWDIGATGLVNANNSPDPWKVGVAKGFSPTSLSSWSVKEAITFPTANTAAFLDAIQTALAVMVLSRSDLPTIDELAETKGAQLVEDAKEGKVLVKDVALLRTGLEPYNKLIFDLFPDFAQVVRAKDTSQVEFREQLALQVTKLANRLRDTSGFTPELEAFVVNATVNLREVTWARLLEAAGEDAAAEHLGEFAGDTIMEHLRGIKRSPTETEQLLLSSDISGIKQKIINAQRGGETEDQYTKQLAAADKQLALMQEKFPPAAAGASMGVAPNPYCIGIPSAQAGALFEIPGMVRLRSPQFIEFDPAQNAGGTSIMPEILADEVPKTLASVPPTIRALYEKYIQPDGSIRVPTPVLSLANELLSAKRVVGSADMSPVYHFNQDVMNKAVESPKTFQTLLQQSGQTPTSQGVGAIYLRTLFGLYEGGVVYQEAVTALQMSAAAALRSAQDGEWIAIRLFDAFPGLEGFFEGIQNWMAALAAAIESIADTLIAYIEFIEARLIELQQLIRRINALIQSILSFTIPLPQFSGLLLVSDGTSGIIRGLTTAENKPFDSPLAYGGGVALLMALLPGIAGSFVKNLILCTGGSPDPDKTIAVAQGDDAFGVDGIGEPPPAQGPNDEPDVL